MTVIVCKNCFLGTAFARVESEDRNRWRENGSWIDLFSCLVEQKSRRKEKNKIFYFYFYLFINLSSPFLIFPRWEENRRENVIGDFTILSPIVY